MKSLFDKWKWRQFFWVVLLGIHPAIAEDNPYLVEDLDTAVSQNGSGFRGGVELGGYIYFPATTDTLGEELWRTDGVPGGTTELVKDINPGAEGSRIEGLAVIGGTIFFAADDGLHGQEFWMSDGTPGGTVMVADINSGADGSGPRYFYEVNGDVVFKASDGTVGSNVSGAELWIYDTSEGTTSLLKDINPGRFSGVSLILTDGLLGGKLYFAADDGTNGTELWVTDGTEMGTEMVKDINAGSNDGVLPTMAVFDSRVFFSATNGTDGYELWATDGTEMGTVQIKDINPGIGDGEPTEFTVLGGNLVFVATSSNVGGIRDLEVWISDGTEMGTERVKDIHTGTLNTHPLGSFPSELVRVGNYVAFEAYDPGEDARVLWKTDGTEAGTMIVGTTPAESPQALTALDNDTLLFTRSQFGVTGREPWVASMSANTVALLKDINPGNSSSVSDVQFTGMHRFGTEVFFSAVADNSSNGDPEGELWKTDGTEMGTVLVAEINNSPRSGDPNQMARLGNRVLFTRTGYSGLNERFLYASDGTMDAVVEVKELAIQNRKRIRKIVPFGNIAFLLVANTDFSIKKYELWKTDGTSGGTVLVKSDIGDYSTSGSNPPKPDQFTPVGNLLFFVTQQGTTGRELWVSDGTTAGTKMVRDLRPGSSSSSPDGLTAMSGEVYFRANDGTTGVDLWKSDGTSNGTVLVKDFGNVGFPEQLTVANDTLFLVASDTHHLDRELWKSDGTSDGTVLVKNIRPGTDPSSPKNLTAVGDTLFFRANDGVHNRELWKSDGTETGTMMVKDINPETDSSLPDQLTAIDDTLFFVADDGVNGIELWKSDGTEGGTELLVDTRPGSALGDGPQELTAVGSELFFRANDGTSGEELWRSDGTDQGTVFFDINSGGPGSGPTGFAYTSTRLFFSATENATGRELWTIPVSVSLPDPDPVVTNPGAQNLALINAVKNKIKRLKKKIKRLKKSLKRAKKSRKRAKIKRIKRVLKRTKRQLRAVRRSI